MIYLTRSTQHLRIKKRKYSSKNYPSGEIKIDIHDDVKGKEVCVIASVLPDPDSLLELLILSDALKIKGAKVNLIMPYLAYARQDKPEKGEPYAARVVCKALSTIAFNKRYILDAHSVKLQHFFRFMNIIPLSIFKKEFSKIKDPVIIAPDKGGIKRAENMAKVMGCGIAYIDKKRLGAGKTKILKLKGDVKGKNAIIIDDMIDTGGTIITASELLISQGASSVYVAATHGLFSKGAIKSMEKAPIKKIIVTNTLPNIPISKKLKTVKIEPLIRSLIR